MMKLLWLVEGTKTTLKETQGIGDWFENAIQEAFFQMVSKFCSLNGNLNSGFLNLSLTSVEL